MDKRAVDRRSPRPAGLSGRSSGDRTWLSAVGWLVAGILLAYIGLEKLRSVGTTQTPVPTLSAAPAEVPSPPQPTATTDPYLNPTWRPASDPTSHPTKSPEAAELSPPQATPPVGQTQPTPDPAVLQRDILEQQFRQRIADAKARMEALQAAAAQECPELKPGDIRLPEAVSQCTRLHAEAVVAAKEYESAKKQALAAGFMMN